MSQIDPVSQSHIKDSLFILSSSTLEPKMKARILLLRRTPSFHSLVWSLQNGIFLCCVSTCCIKLGCIQDVYSIACRHVRTKGILY